MKILDKNNVYMMLKCKNCGKHIGKLQAPYYIEGYTEEKGISSIRNGAFTSIILCNKCIVKKMK